jgi:DNA-binding response OmpR family regulator
MVKVLLATQDQALFSDMTDAFQNHGIQVNIALSGGSALSQLADASYDLLIADKVLADMTGKTLIEKIIMENPFINCVAVSTLSHKDFHEEYEGMGVLMQFPDRPGTTDVQKLLEHLNKINSISK